MGLCSSRPITGRRGGIAEHLYKIGARPQHGKLDVVKDGLKKGLKYAVGGAVFYFAMSLALGGRDRVKHDLEVLKVRDWQTSCPLCKFFGGLRGWLWEYCTEQAAEPR